MAFAIALLLITTKNVELPHSWSNRIYIYIYYKSIGYILYASRFLITLSIPHLPVCEHKIIRPSADTERNEPPDLICCIKKIIEIIEFMEKISSYCILLANKKVVLGILYDVSLEEGVQSNVFINGTSSCIGNKEQAFS